MTAKMLKKLFPAALAVCMLAACLSACGETGADSGRGAPPGAEVSSGIGTSPEPSVDASPEPSEDGSAAKGETIYTGFANFAKTQDFTVSFILSEDKTTVHDLKFVITGFSSVYFTSGRQSEFTIGESTVSPLGDYPVQDGRLEVDMEGSFKLLVDIDGDTAGGTVSFVVTVRDADGTNLHFDLGESPIEFTASKA